MRGHTGDDTTSKVSAAEGDGLSHRGRVAALTAGFQKKACGGPGVKSS